ncbi:hypothetical protein Q7P37_001322 [Cladosporium fusiforme]
MTPKRSILIINPNTTQSMTSSLKPLIDSLLIPKDDTLSVHYYTAPTGPPSINSESDALLSLHAVLPDLLSTKLLETHTAFLICCYSSHPLVPALRQHLASQSQSHKPVTGIFEASLATTLQSISAPSTFGIVSTGAQWAAILDDAVAKHLGSASSKRYAGTETTGLSAVELHTTPKDEVDRRVKDATKRLLARGGESRLSWVCGHGGDGCDCSRGVR